jgi:hypothetical protein
MLLVSADRRFHFFVINRDMTVDGTSRPFIEHNILKYSSLDVRSVAFNFDGSVSFIYKNKDAYILYIGHFEGITLVCDRTIVLVLNDPMGMTWYNLSTLIIADSGNNRLVVVVLDQYIKYIGGETGFQDGDEPRFNSPTNVLLYHDQTIIVSDTGNNCIRRIYFESDKFITETIAGNPNIKKGTPTGGYKDGNGNVARFNKPYGLCLNGNSILVADSNNNRIRSISLKES